MRETIPAGTPCEYGCKNEAKFVLKTRGGVKKHCCSPHYQQCPAQKLRRGAITRTAHAKQQLDGTVFRRGILRQYKRSAHKRELQWTMTDNHFYNLMRGLCYYCGWQPTQPRQFNGVDRFDVFLDYTPQNSIPCCAKCATMKVGLSPEEFQQHLKRILERHPNGILHPSKAIITKSA
jgi:hypothetical protein